MRDSWTSFVIWTSCSAERPSDDIDSTPVETLTTVLPLSVSLEISFPQKLSPFFIRKIKQISKKFVLKSYQNYSEFLTKFFEKKTLRSWTRLIDSRILAIWTIKWRMASCIFHYRRCSASGRERIWYSVRNIWCWWFESNYWKVKKITGNTLMNFKTYSFSYFPFIQFNSNLIFFII